MTAKKNRLAPKNGESLIVIKEDMAMVEDFITNGEYENEKSKDDSNPFAKINIKEQERNDDVEHYFNGKSDAEEEEDVFFFFIHSLVIYCQQTAVITHKGLSFTVVVVST